MINAIIVDDEPLALDVLETFIGHDGYKPKYAFSKKRNKFFIKKS